MVPSSEVTSQNQTQPQTCGSSEPSFADVVRMTTTIQFCDSRCPIAIEKLIADVDKYRQLAEFSDITSNLVLQLRCSSEILDMSQISPENTFSENCRRLRENFGISYPEARKYLTEFIRRADEEPIDAFYRFEKILRTPALNFQKMDDLSRSFWISESMKKILPTEPYRHYSILLHQKGETDDLRIIRNLLKQTMELFPSIAYCNAITEQEENFDHETDQLSENETLLMQVEAHQMAIDELKRSQATLEKCVLSGIDNLADEFKNLKQQNPHHETAEDYRVDPRHNLCETCVNAGFPRSKALHSHQSCPNRTRLGNELFCSSAEAFPNLPKTKIKIADETLLMLIDSGANINLISETVATKLPFRRSNSHHTVRVASGNVMRLYESIVADVVFTNGVLRNIEFHICPNLSHEVILGTYVLRQFSLDLDDGTAILQGIPVDLVHQGTSITCCLTEKIVVEPESYKNISLESPLPDNIRDEEPAII